jgi:hypothetical protein
MQLKMPIEVRRRDDSAVPRPEPRRAVAETVRLLAAVVVGAAIAHFLDPERGRRRRHTARDRALATGRRGARNAVRRAERAAGPVRGVAHRAGGTVHHTERDYDEVTLARKVESEIFRPVGAPKGTVNVNVHEHVVELRGTVERPELIAALGDAAAAVDGVERVENLLHTPGTPARHAPPSDPAEVRARANAHHGG